MRSACLKSETNDLTNVSTIPIRSPTKERKSSTFVDVGAIHSSKRYSRKTFFYRDDSTDHTSLTLLSVFDDGIRLKSKVVYERKEDEKEKRLIEGR